MSLLEVALETVNMIIRILLKAFRYLFGVYKLVNLTSCASNTQLLGIIENAQDCNFLTKIFM